MSRRTCSDDARPCAWCERPIPGSARSDAVTCSRKCRQSIWRLRKRGLVRPPASVPARFAYADPPYPGLAEKYYRDEPDYQGEVDHEKLIQLQLMGGGYAGWALSTSAAALQDVLALCPLGIRVCSWVKPIGVPHRSTEGRQGKTHGPHSAWEPLLIYGGRFQQGGVRDWLEARPARHGGKLPGRKPIAFCAWLFELMGMQPGDELDDLFPGTGVVGRSWRALGGVSPASATNATRRPGRDDASSCSRRHVARPRTTEKEREHERTV